MNVKAEQFARKCSIRHSKHDQHSSFDLILLLRRELLTGLLLFPFKSIGLPYTSEFQDAIILRYIITAAWSQLDLHSEQQLFVLVDPLFSVEHALSCLKRGISIHQM